MCVRCEELEEEVTQLKHALSLESDPTECERIRSAYGLTAQQAHVLAILAKRGERFTTSLLLDRGLSVVWRSRRREGRSDPDSLIKVHVCRLRQIIGKDAIETVYGLGYRLSPLARRNVLDLMAA